MEQNPVNIQVALDFLEKEGQIPDTLFVHQSLV